MRARTSGVRSVKSLESSEKRRLGSGLVRESDFVESSVGVVREIGKEEGDVEVNIYIVNAFSLDKLRTEETMGCVSLPSLARTV